MEKAKLRILICEDEGLTVLRLQKELDSLGYTVVGEAKNGLEAVKLAIKLEPDVILMDIKMPKLDGIDATKEIMATQPTAIIMLTAYGQEDFVGKVIEAGASAYLLKPVNSGQLLPTIELAAHRFTEFQRIESEAKDLKEALEVRKLIERAKGILMHRSSLSEPEAFKKMQRISQNSRKPMKDIALEILRADEIFSSPKL